MWISTSKSTPTRHQKKFSSIVDSFDLRQMVETVTHRAGNTLDIVFVGSESSDGISILVQPAVISDHSVITIQLPMCKPPPVSMQQHSSGRIVIEKLSGRVWRTVFSVHRSVPEVGCQSTTCRRRIRPYWRHSSINSLHAWLLTNTTDRSHPGSTPSVMLRIGSRVALRKPTVAPGCPRIEPSGLISFDRLSWQFLITNSSWNARKLWNPVISNG